MHAVFSKYGPQCCYFFSSLHFAQVEAIVRSANVEEGLGKLFQNVPTVRDNSQEVQTPATQALARPLHGDVNIIFAALQHRGMLKISGLDIRCYTCGTGGHVSMECPLKNGNVMRLLLYFTNSFIFFLTQLAAKNNHQAATGRRHVLHRVRSANEALQQCVFTPLWMGQIVHDAYFFPATSASARG